ncbi:DUF998 domain-containing protein [Paenarthrobacter sp. Z7-10]|uniref:DUF998 domain-containing protein n=1 Tax=Paenarthrobacter sp. Z7-10 TaxID=2787635 RepID=UPI0022A9513D|nr:DUF998 domain-containing protein [Paenarthrobacter sp. Z7-10]MCZ2402612.1 DUF998 domain-containing protein [Paenarthrobacter sp. Z7-10]
MATSAAQNLPARNARLQLAGTRSLVGAWAKISILQYFLAEAAVIAGWAGPLPYSRRLDVISDLGARSCGVYDGRAVCSPLHILMNVSFIVQGVAMMVGAVLLSTALFRIAARPEPPTAVKRPGWAILTRLLVGLSGLGVMVVGFVPEDVDTPLHFAGASVFFVAGGLSLLALWWSWRRLRLISWFLLLCGTLSLVSTILFALVPALERGTLERLMAYPITLGLSLVGVTVTRGVRQARQNIRKDAVARSRSSPS